MARPVLGFLVLLFVNVFGCQTASSVEPGCLEKRAALDIGSGATRVKVAQVDVCRLRIVETLFEAQEKVSYQEDLQRATDATLSATILAEGLRAIQSLKTQAASFSPKAIVATATSAFRRAKNGKEAAAGLGREAGIPIHVLAQDEEGQLGFLGAAQAVEGPLEHVAVWDIGGGSQQVTTRDRAGQYQVFESQLASVSFQEHLVKNVQGKPSAASPNPVSAEDSAAGLDYVREQLAAAPAALKSFLADENTTVIGIGGVHFYSIKGQVGSEEYDHALLTTTLEKRLGLSDAEIGGDFPATDVANLILVRGAFEALGVKKVKAVRVNLADGAMLYPKFWEGEEDRAVPSLRMTN